MNLRFSPLPPNRPAAPPALLLALLLGLPSCRQEPGAGAAAAGADPAGPMPPAEVSVVTVKAEPVPVKTELAGRLEGVRVAEVRARANGILLKRHFEEGSTVQEGQLLFEIDPAPLEAALKSAEAGLVKAGAGAQQARAKAGRYQTLSGNNAVSRQENEDAAAAAATADAEVLVARAAVDTARLNLGYTRVTAPITGRIGGAMVTEGALVSASAATPMALVQQLDPIYLDFTQSSTELLRLQRALGEGKLNSAGDQAARVSLLLEDGSTYPEAGKLLFSGVTVEPSTGMVTMRAEFPNPSQLLLPGMFGRASLEQAVDTSALTLPQRVVTRNGDGSGTVMVVNAEGKVEPRIVKADRAVGNKWIISEGVKAGEQVIIEGLQKVRPGAVVKPVPFAPALADNSHRAPLGS